MKLKRGDTDLELIQKVLPFLKDPEIWSAVRQVENMLHNRPTTKLAPSKDTEETPK